MQCIEDLKKIRHLDTPTYAFILEIKIYIPSTINISRKLVSIAIWADKTWAGFRQIYLYIQFKYKILKIITINIVILIF